MRFVVLGFAAIVLAACVSTGMSRYVGLPIQEAFINYGQPENVIDMPDGRRAYQFRVGESSAVIPSHTTATGTTVNGVTTMSATTTPGGIVRSDGCLVTFIARQNGNVEVIEEYRVPQQLIC